MFNVSFWGGPRDGDLVYQVPNPSENYWEPVDPPYAILENFKLPVVMSTLSSIESHHYELRWDSPVDCVYIYKGIVNRGM